MHHCAYSQAYNISLHALTSLIATSNTTLFFPNLSFWSIWSSGYMQNTSKMSKHKKASVFSLFRLIMIVLSRFFFIPYKYELDLFFSLLQGIFASSSSHGSLVMWISLKCKDTISKAFNWEVKHKNVKFQEGFDIFWL